jgi:hypothetical protein
MRVLCRRRWLSRSFALSLKIELILELFEDLKSSLHRLFIDEMSLERSGHRHPTYREPFLGIELGTCPAAVTTGLVLRGERASACGAEP